VIPALPEVVNLAFAINVRVANSAVQSPKRVGVRIDVDAAKGEGAANRFAAGSQNVPELRASAVDDREGRGSVQDIVFRAARALLLVGLLPGGRVVVLDGRAPGREGGRQAVTDP
jgi:hypothetical protein